MAGSGGIPEAARTHVRGRVAHYHIVQRLGEGGMGVVLLARDEALGRNVALKLLAPRYADDVQFRARFVRESRLAAAIDHPNIIPIFEAGEADGQLFIAMRYVGGRDLRELLMAEGPLEPARAVAIVEQVARALDAAHNAGLVHRDVKPGNVMIDASEGTEHCYLTDFGLTKNMSSSSGYTETGQFVGTLHYMAPEQIEGRKVDARADQYALGCVLFECLTGVPPFQRDSDVAMMYAHLHESPPPVCAARPELPAATDEVLARALAKAPSDRHSTCSAMVGELRAALAGAAVPPFRPSSNGTGRRFSRAPAPAPPAQPLSPSRLPTRERQPAAPPAPPAWSPPPPYVHQPPTTLPPATAPIAENGHHSALRAAVILAAAIVLCAGGIAAALIARGGSGAPTESAAQKAHRQLVERTVRLNRKVVTVSRRVERMRGKTGAATKARLQKDLQEAKKIAAAARAEQASSVAGTSSLTAATAKLTGVVMELQGLARGQNHAIARLRGDLNDLGNQVNSLQADQGSRQVEVPRVTTPLAAAGAVPASIKLPGDAVSKVIAPAGRLITSAVSVGDIDGNGTRDYGFVTNAADGRDANGFVVLDGTGGEVDLGSLASDQGFEVKGATSLAPAGDVNGDQIDDLAAVGPLDAATGTATSVFVIHGADSLKDVDLRSGSADVQIDLPVADATTAAAPVVQSAGDFNNDGAGDLVVGDPSANGGRGGAWIVLGSDQPAARVSLDSLDASQGFAMTGDEGDGFGSSVSSADVNGDGMSDVIVGAPHAGGDDSGAAFVVYGTDPVPDGVDVGQLGDQGFAITGPKPGALAGTVVAGLEDQSGDDNVELLVTAPGSGTAYVVFGPGDTSPDISLASLADGGYEIDGPASGFGTLAAAAGDVDGDGRSDVVIGGPGSGGGGLAYLVYGSSDTTPVDVSSGTDRTLAIEGSGDTPTTVAGNGDIDGNGQSDVLVAPSGSSTVYAISGRRP